MNLNVRAIFLLSQKIGKGSMIPNKYGGILNVASIAGLQGAAGMIAYNTSKGAVVNFTRGLAADWGKHGITVNALAPGMFATKMTRDYSNESAEMRSPSRCPCAVSATKRI